MPPPQPRSSASNRRSPSAIFDMVAFSLSFENDYPNILRILDLAGIPLAAEIRREGPPLVIGGGIAATPQPRTPRRLLRPLPLRRRRGRSPRISGCRGRPPPAAYAGGIPRPCAERDSGAYVPRYYRVTYQCDGRIAARSRRRRLPRRIPNGGSLTSTHSRPNRASPPPARSSAFSRRSAGGAGGLPFLRRRFRLPAGAFPERRVSGGLLPAGARKRKTIGLFRHGPSRPPRSHPLCRSILDSGGGDLWPSALSALIA